MSEFWLWFMRPIAETLGVLALLAVVVAAFFAYWMAVYWFNRIKQWLRREAR